MEKVDRIILPPLFDLHQHFRDGSIMEQITVPLVCERFAGAVVMPNLTPPIVTFDDIWGYSRRLHAALSQHIYDHPEVPGGFTFMMTLYMTGSLTAKTVMQCIETDKFWFAGIKYYPRGLTTNSDSGLESPSEMWTPHTEAWRVLRTLATYGKTFFIHAADGLDDKGNEADPYDQERLFLRNTLPRIRYAHPELKISLEHLSTEEGAEVISSGHSERGRDPNLGCSLTPHHLLLDRRDMFRGGLNVNRFWLPVIQRKEDQTALRQLIVDRHPRVWLGSDSAPHPRASKLADCCKGGVLTAHAGVELYLEVFDQLNRLDWFESFARWNGAKFVGFIDGNALETVDQDACWTTYQRESWQVSRFLAYPADCDDDRDEQLIPFRAGEMMQWKMLPRHQAQGDKPDTEYLGVINENEE